MVKPGGDGVALLYTSIVLLTLSWVVFIPRVAVRIWRKALGTDDYVMFCGLVSFQFRVISNLIFRFLSSSNTFQLLYSVTASLCIVCSFLGSGQLAAALTPAVIQKGTKV